MFIPRIINVILLSFIITYHVSAQIHKKYYTLAQKSFYLLNYDEAIKFADEVIKLKPNESGAYLLKGKCLLEMEKFNEALDQFYHANNLQPQESEYFFYKGFCEWKLKRFSKAIKTLEESLEYCPDNLLSYMFIGAIYYEIGMFANATHHFNKALDIDPSLSVNIFVRNKFLEVYKDEYNIVMNVCNKAVAKKSPKLEDIFYRALLKAMVGDTQSAFSDINLAIRKNPDFNIFYFYRGYIAYGIRNIEYSITDLQKYLGTQPADKFAEEIYTNVNAIKNLKIEND